MLGLPAPGAIAVLALLSPPVCAVSPGEGFECPPGTSRIATDDPYEPFECLKPGEHKGPFLHKIDSFKRKPKCPMGFRPVRTPGRIQRWRCLVAPRKSSEPDIAPASKGPRESPSCPPGQKRLPTQDPFEPFSCVPEAGALKPPREYLRYQIRGELELDYPKGWHLTDGWQDEVPTLYAEYDTGRQGRQVTLVVTKVEKSQYGYVDMPTAIAREKEWQNAAEGGRGLVAGLPARFTYVLKENRSAYVALGSNAYYTLSYSAPEDLFAAFEPAYERLLKSLRISAGEP